MLNLLIQNKTIHFLFGSGLTQNYGSRNSLITIHFQKIQKQYETTLQNQNRLAKLLLPHEYLDTYYMRAKLYQKFLSDKIDFAVFPSLQGGPHNNVISAVAVALKEASTPEFHEYILNVKNNTKLLGEELVDLGYQLCTNGTENHLLLLNLRNQGITGSKVEYMLEKVNISVNKNTIIGDKSALSPSGIRIGLCAMTTRGLKENNCKELASLIHRVIVLAKDIPFKKLADFKNNVNQLFDEGKIEYIQLKEDILQFSSQLYY